jgi:hypothetical protein
MSRALWFVAGAGAGVYALTKARRAAEALTPEGLTDRLAGLSVGARLLGDEIRAGMAEKENDLRERIGLTLPVNHRTTPELSEPHAALADRGTDNSATREGND